MSIFAKEVLYRATKEVGQRINSPVLMANAWHHRSDALSSIVALVGIAGSMMGMSFLDPLAGIVVGGMVLWMGLRISLEAVSQLTDTSDMNVVQQIQAVAEEVAGVDRVHEVRTRSMGASSLADLAIQVDPTLSASCAHRLAEEVRYRVMSITETPISEVLVHVDTLPHDATCPLQTHVLGGQRHHEEVEMEVAAQLRTLREVQDVPRVATFYLEEGLGVEAHLRVADNLTVAQLRDVAARGTELLRRSSPDLTDVRISVDLPPLEGEAAGDAEGSPKELAASGDRSS